MLSNPIDIGLLVHWKCLLFREDSLKREKERWRKSQLVLKKLKYEQNFWDKFETDWDFTCVSMIFVEVFTYLGTCDHWNHAIG